MAIEIGGNVPRFGTKGFAVIQINTNTYYNKLQYYQIVAYLYLYYYECNAKLIRK